MRIRIFGALSPNTPDYLLGTCSTAGLLAFISVGVLIYNAALVFLSPRNVEYAFREYHHMLIPRDGIEAERARAFAEQEWGCYAENRENAMLLRFNSCVPPIRSSWKVHVRAICV